MMNEPPVLNFQWHIENLLATGGKPDTDEKLDWLIAQGFKYIVSLESIPDNISRRIFTQMSGTFRTSREETKNDETTKRWIMEAIASQIIYDLPVYMHCSAGIKLSVSMAQKFAARKDLHIANYLGLRANDLNHGDNFDWMRGHDAFDGLRINQAIAALKTGLKSEDSETRLAAADTLAKLMEHADHHCFNHQAIRDLERLLPKVEKVVYAGNRRYRKQYQKIFADFYQTVKLYRQGR